MASTLSACNRDDGIPENAVYPFDCYDIMHTVDAPADDEAGRIRFTEGADPWRSGDIIYLERDGLFVYRDRMDVWSQHWGYATNYGKYNSDGIQPTPGQKYYCAQTATQYVANENGRLEPIDATTEPIKVTTWNIGGFNNGNSSTFTAKDEENYQSVLSRFAPVMELLDADLIGLCEYLPSIFESREIRQDLMGPYPFEAFSEVANNYLGKALYSRFCLSNVKQLSIFGSIALEADITVGGRIFKVCLCHPVWWTTDGNPNRKSLEYLAKRYKYTQRVILMGDFNFPKDAEQESLKIFTDVGFSAANLSRFGSLRTSYNTVLGSPALDNIFTKGAEILSVSVLQYTPEGLDPANPRIADESLWDAVNPSDHFPFSALLRPF